MWGGCGYGRTLGHLCVSYRRRGGVELCVCVKVGIGDALTRDTFEDGGAGRGFFINMERMYIV